MLRDGAVSPLAGRRLAVEPLVGHANQGADEPCAPVHLGLWERYLEPTVKT